MIGNRIHFLELLLMGIAEPTRFAFRFRNLPPANTVKLISLLVPMLLLTSLRFHLSLDPRRFFTDTVHNLLCLGTEIRFGPCETEVEPRGRHVTR